MSQKKPVSELRQAISALNPYFKKAGGFSLIATLLILAPSVYMLEVYDRVVNSRSYMTLAMLTLLVLAVMGWLLDRIAIRPLERKKTLKIGAFSWILTTAGIALIVQNVIELLFGKTSQYSPPLFSS